MSEKKGLMDLGASSCIIAKIILLFILYLAALCVPLLAQDFVRTSFAGFDSNAPFNTTNIANNVFAQLFNGFAVFIGGLFVFNLVFRLINEILNDTVTSRRVVQIVFNILIILGGALYLLYLANIQIPSSVWWTYSDFYTNSSRGSAFYWGGAVLFSACAIVLSILDNRTFAAESRHPGYRKHRLDKCRH